jgi:hypothetical protein
MRNGSYKGSARITQRTPAKAAIGNGAVCFGGAGSHPAGFAELVSLRCGRERISPGHYSLARSAPFTFIACSASNWAILGR